VVLEEEASELSSADVSARGVGGLVALKGSCLAVNRPVVVLGVNLDGSAPSVFADHGLRSEVTAASFGLNDDFKVPLCEPGFRSLSCSGTESTKPTKFSRGGVGILSAVGLNAVSAPLVAVFPWASFGMFSSWPSSEVGWLESTRFFPSSAFDTSDDKVRARTGALLWGPNALGEMGPPFARGLATGIGKTDWRAVL
jgi:hypothetical protein